MCIAAEILFNPDMSNLYFADFYCNYTTHYVTVVCCMKGSDTDLFCSKVLIPLNPERNPFIQCIRYADGWHQYWVSRKCWIEFYYTENVPLSLGLFDAIIATGAGTSTPGGLPHNKFCRICNIYPLSRGDGSDENEETTPAATGDATNSKISSTASADGGGGNTGAVSDMVATKRTKYPDDFEYNLTFHLSMELERERLIIGSIDETGQGDPTLPGQSVIDRRYYSQ